MRLDESEESDESRADEPGFEKIRVKKKNGAVMEKRGGRKKRRMTRRRREGRSSFVIYSLR